MTERTFRDPSPSRNNVANLYMDYDDPPPMPAFPKGYGSPPPVPAKSLRRPASVEPPERVISPVPRVGGRGVSLDRGPGVVHGKQTKKKQATNLGAVEEAERAQNRESINFSRPMSPQNSPPTSPLKELKAKPANIQAQTQAPKANMAALRDGEADNIQYAVRDTATRPVKKKKKAVAKDFVEGSHFAGGGGARPTGTAVQTPSKAPNSVSSTPSPADTKGIATNAADPPQLVPKKKKKKRVVSSDSSQGSYTSDSDSAMSDRSTSADRPRTFNTRAAGFLTKQPSIVREDREAEEQEEEGSSIKQPTLQNGTVTKAPVLPIPETSVTAKQHKKSASQPPMLSTSIDNSPLDIPGTTTNTTNNAENLTAHQPRPQSLSPGRAAHFLSQPMYETPDGFKHQPPARSVSPAKSALKHSPSSRGASPVGFASVGPSRLSGVAGSEASYDESVLSDDSGKLLPTKKKGARVSFDEDSVILGRASTPPVTESPTLLSPQHKESASKGFLGFGRRKKDEVSPNELDQSQDDVIKPTPSLPSFGSIRDKKRGESDFVPQGIDPKNVVQGPLPGTHTSSDRNVGYVLSQDFSSRPDTSNEYAVNQQVPSDPLPPEVTTVEGTGYHSEDEESIHGNTERVKMPETSVDLLPVSEDTEPRDATTAPQPRTSEYTTQAEEKSAMMQNGTVPAISILPATPGIGGTEDEQDDWFKMPGGFVAATDDHEVPTEPAAVDDAAVISSAPAGHNATDLTPANLGIAEPEPESTALSPTGSPIIGHVAESLHQQTEAGNADESDDTGNSIYSDAAEDMSDIEGDGFGSINAIMESPVLSKSPTATNLVPEVPGLKTSNSDRVTVRPSTVTRSESEMSEPQSEEGWDQAQAYWSGLSQSRKEQLERAAMPDVAEETQTKATAASAPEEKPKGKRMSKKAPTPNDPPLPPWPDKEFRREVVRPASPTTGGMKHSMRPQQPSTSQPQMRASMRDNVPPKSALRNSVQNPENKPSAQGPLKKKKDRPVSAIDAGDYSKPNGKPPPSHGRAASLGIAPKTAVASAPPSKKQGKPVLRRAFSNGSDSSSSFKKTKPSTTDSGKYTMKRTMRSGTTDSRPQSAYADKQASLSGRTTSPPARRPFSTVGPGGMRTSMRDSIDSGLGSRTKSPSRGFGFGRNAKAKQSGAEKTGSRFSSRFGDSSDEDEIGPKRGSRFKDSSDEEEDNAGLTPVRGIPRRIDEGDSTDLEDSSASPSPAIRADEKPPIAVTSTTHNPSKGSALATGSLRSGVAQQETGTNAETEKKKRSFFGSRRKPKPQSSLNISPPMPNPTSGTPHPLEANHATPIETPSSPKSPNVAKLTGNPITATSPKSQASPKPPKLQRRHTPKRFASDSWPLPEMPAAAAEKARPSTSDGAGGKPLALGTMRPQSGQRRVTAEREPINGTVGGGKDAGKKKRFPMLRKALGLQK